MAAANITPMKNSIEHLPQQKQEDLNKIVGIITEKNSDVLMIILFGSYARGDWREEKDLQPNRRSGHASDYDILVVTGEKRTAGNAGLWQLLSSECNASGITAHVKIIVNDIEQLNIDLARGQYFYTEIKEQGCALFNSCSYELADMRQLTPSELQREAQDYFDHWFKLAQGAYSGYATFIENDDLNWAAFHLNQAAETCYKTILLVFSCYSPHEHHLDLLESMSSKHVKNIKEIFPRETKEQKQRFDLLDCAYIDARYNMNFSITGEDLEYLSSCVGKLIKITEEQCLEKISDFMK